MPTTERRQPLNIRETQMEIPAGTPAFTEDFEGQMAQAHSQLALLQAKKQELEQQQLALELLNQQKHEFLAGQLDLVERFSSTVTAIERDLFTSKQEIDDLEQTRTAFVKLLHQIEALNPEAWPKDKLSDQLTKALVVLDQAESEYEQAASYFAGSRKGSLFGRGQSSSLLAGTASDFRTMLRNGFAFNLPLIIISVVALLVYLTK